MFAGKSAPASTRSWLRARSDDEVATSRYQGGLPHGCVRTVRPEIVVQVAFIEWTVHGKLRHSRLTGIREGTSPRDVVRET